MLIIPHRVRRWFTDPRMLSEIRVFTLAITASVALLAAGGYVLHQKINVGPDPLIVLDQVSPRYQVSVR